MVEQKACQLRLGAHILVKLGNIATSPAHPFTHKEKVGLSKCWRIKFGGSVWAADIAHTGPPIYTS
jgi:hypothetical protein